MAILAEVRVRKLDDWVVEHLRHRAHVAGRSLEEELRQLLTSEARRRKQVFADELHALREELREKYGPFPDSAAEIRAEREERESRW